MGEAGSVPVPELSLPRVLGSTHTEVKRGAGTQFLPKLLLNKVVNLGTFSLSSLKLRQSLKS